MTPEPPRALQARVDEELAYDIGVLTKAGLSYADMVKQGVSVLRDLHEQAWRAGVVPEGQTPELLEYVFARPVVQGE